MKIRIYTTSYSSSVDCEYEFSSKLDLCVMKMHHFLGFGGYDDNKNRFYVCFYN